MEGNMEVGVLFESNDGIIALNKPPGICSQGPGDGEFLELWEMVREKRGGNIVHRIDKWTSGVNLAGTSRKVRGYLCSNWHRITKKVYLAIIKSSDWEKKVVDTLIDGKSAVTAFKVLERFESFALVNCELVQNGRTHQIRRHLKSIRSPIVGDQKYNGPKTDVRGGQLLHAWQMKLCLPGDDGRPGSKSVTIQAPIPEDFRIFGFDWARWSEGSNEAKETWPVIER